VPRFLIINADDFGASPGVNRGIIEAHTNGIVTSTTLMVDQPAARAAAELAQAHPGLGVGLHWDLDGRDLSDAGAVRSELTRQLDAFAELTGRPPTHLDSHHHVHRVPGVRAIAKEIAARAGLPLRGEPPFGYVGGFYGQWAAGVTDLYHVSPEFLIWLLQNEVGDGVTEIGCHPGYAGGLKSSYLAEREVERRTLTDGRVRAEIDALEIRLASFADVAELD
jgi:chitin disaccharide deacetylase